MKLVFFDIECSNGHDICSFGYCLVDSNFKLIKKEDIVINPESKINLAPKGKRAKIELAYSQEYFMKQNPFDFYYEKIAKLLTNEKYILFGHSIASDFGFLNHACRRYNLPSLTLKGFDSQKLYHIIYKTDHLESLEKIVEELDIEKQFIYHKSSEDAEATMLVLKKIMKENDLSLADLKERYSDCIVESNSQQPKKRVSFNEKVDAIRAKYSNLHGKVAFSDGFKQLSAKEQLKLIEKLFQNGYDYTNKIFDCNIFVLDDIKAKRYNYYNYLSSRGRKFETYNFNDFIAKLNKNIIEIENS